MPSPSPSAARHRGSMIRQLSLQSQSSGQSSAGRRSLKKQLSVDDSRSRGLNSVEITGQGWCVNQEKIEAGLREPPKYGQLKTVTVSRPRPVKLAWADRKQDSTDCPTGVEVVARKCQGQPRSLTAKAQRITNLPLLGDKDSLVYTRQQLAERLRIAWRERERNKPNLNIFLAHAADACHSSNDEGNTGRSTGVPQTEILIKDSISFRSGTVSESSVTTRKNHETEQIRKILPRDTGQSEKVEQFSSGESKSKDSRGLMKQRDGKDNHEITDGPDFKTFPVNESSKVFGSNLTNFNYQAKALKMPVKNVEESIDVLQKGKENIDNSPRSDSGFSEQSKTAKSEELDGEITCNSLEIHDDEIRLQATAQERRASFRSGSTMKKTINESYSQPDSSEDEVSVSQVRDNEIKVILKKNDEERPPLTRTFSAPTRNDNHLQKNQTAPKIMPKPLTHFASSIDLIANEEDSLRARIKSAPIRRKLKTAASRRKHREKDQESSDDEKQARDTSKKKTSRRKATSRVNASDIITMVSLVSPATSDAEDSVIPIPEETWTAEKREEKGNTAVNEAGEKSGRDPAKEISSFIIQKFVSLRKTTKTVSFVQHPPINRSYSASFPSRRAPAGTPIIIPTPVITNPALTPAQLQEREKRPPSVGIPVGTDNRGIKRRLIRTISAPQVKENQENISKEPFDEEPKKEFGKIEETDEGAEEEPKAPEFKTPKEKECWVLYRKMLEKGVSVSFDTVLRGMLTPTEYRLRRNQLLSSC